MSTWFIESLVLFQMTVFMYYSFWIMDCRNEHVIDHLPRQNMTIDIRITMTEMRAITRAHCDVSGYSNRSQIFRWTSGLGNMRSSSLMKPSSSRNLLKASSPNSKNLISSVNTSWKHETKSHVRYRSLKMNCTYRSARDSGAEVDHLIGNSRESHQNLAGFDRKSIRFVMDQRNRHVEKDYRVKFEENYSRSAIVFQISSRRH